MTADSHTLRAYVLLNSVFENDPVKAGRFSMFAPGGAFVVWVLPVRLSFCRKTLTSSDSGQRRTPNRYDFSQRCRAALNSNFRFHDPANMLVAKVHSLLPNC